MQTTQTQQAVTHNVMMFGDRRVMNIKGPDFEMQIDLLPGETQEQALWRHYFDADTTINRLIRKRSRLAAVMDSES